LFDLLWGQRRTHFGKGSGPKQRPFRIGQGHGNGFFANGRLVQCLREERLLKFPAKFEGPFIELAETAAMDLEFVPHLFSLFLIEDALEPSGWAQGRTSGNTVLGPAGWGWVVHDRRLRRLRRWVGRLKAGRTRPETDSHNEGEWNRCISLHKSRQSVFTDCPVGAAGLERQEWGSGYFCRLCLQTKADAAARGDP
jgi:hypothetical protein